MHYSNSDCQRGFSIDDSKMALINEGQIVFSLILGAQSMMHGLGGLVA
jgi:hypothetical protein